MKIKCIETFEYELELPDGLDSTQILKQIWRIRDTVDCVADMPTPFWDDILVQNLYKKLLNMIKLSDIEEALKTLKYKSPIISVDNNYVTIQIDTGWLIISKEKFNKLINDS